MLIGAKINLRSVERSDLPTFLKWINDPEVTRYLLINPPFSMEMEEAWYRRHLEEGTMVYCIETKEGRLIGNIGLLNLDWKDRRVDLGIVIGEKDCWSQGYGSDAIETLLRFLFEELNLNRVFLFADAENTRAIRCYQKCGFRQEGVFRKARFKDGCYRDDVAMSILKEDWLKEMKSDCP